MLAKISINKKGEGRISAEDIMALGIASESHVEAEIVIKENHKELKPVEIQPEKTLQDILDDYEKRYRMTSDECAKLLEDDAIEESIEILRWIGFYKLAQRAITRHEDPAEVRFKLVAKKSF